ncbi:MAG TPA: hypothetical protein VGI13_05280 [Candidatus Acidoferrum sp.]|jgi:hypothetical protein
MTDKKGKGSRNQQEEERPSGRALLGTRRRLLPKNGRAFVRAINRKIDVVDLMVELLRGPDDKLAGRLVEQLLDMAYEKSSRAAESQMTGFVEVPRPVRD